MKHIKQIALSALIILITVSTQSSSCHAQNLDTRKGYDLRGYGFDSAMGFIARHYPELPIIVTVATNDNELIQNVKNIIRNLDREGYEDITLVLHPDNPNSKVNVDNPSTITFYRIGDPVAAIMESEKSWFIIFRKSGNMDAIKLEEKENKYPNMLIRMLIKKLFKT